MNWMEVALLVLGVGAFAASFCLPEKKKENQSQEIDPEIIRKLIDKELADAKGRVSEVVDETLEYAVEKTERAAERISNEKIMAISEYSETVLADMNKTHQEIMFLYDMLNDKHKNLKETVKQVDKQAKEAEEKVNAVASVLASKEDSPKSDTAQEIKAVPEKKSHMAGRRKSSAEERNSAPDSQEKEEKRITLEMLQPVLHKEKSEIKAVQPEKTIDRQEQQAEFHVLEPQKLPEVKEHKTVEVYSFAEQAPRVERPVKKETQAVQFENTVSMIHSAEEQELVQEQPVEEEIKENNNDRILRLHKEGKSSVAIAKELGLGVGEVKLVINLFKGA